MPRYGTFKDALLNAYVLGQVPDPLPTWMVCGVDSSYTFDTTHSTFDDLGDSVVLDPAEIEDVSWFLANVDGSDVLYERPDNVGLTVVAVVIYLLSGVDTQLVAYTTQSSESTLPFTFVDSNVIIQWSELGIFKL